MARKPRVIGVGFAISSVTATHPLPHDIPMDPIITKNGCTPRRTTASTRDSPIHC